MEYVEVVPDISTVVGYPYPTIIAVTTVPAGAGAPFNRTVPWKRQGGPASGGSAVGGGVFIGATVGLGVGVGVGDSVGTTVGVGVGTGVSVGVGVGAAPPPQAKAANTSTSTANGTNIIAIFFILSLSSFSAYNSPDYTTEKFLEE